MKPLVQVELKKNQTFRSRLTSYGQMDRWTFQLLYARGHKNECSPDCCAEWLANFTSQLDI
jgi:hypothetical protein